MNEMSRRSRRVCPASPPEVRDGVAPGARRSRRTCPAGPPEVRDGVAPGARRSRRACPAGPPLGQGSPEVVKSGPSDARAGPSMPRDRPAPRALPVGRPGTVALEWSRPLGPGAGASSQAGFPSRKRVVPPARTPADLRFAAGAWRYRVLHERLKPYKAARERWYKAADLRPAAGERRSCRPPEGDGRPRSRGATARIPAQPEG